ncbi:MAG TPA: hypothetical protein VGY55_05855 [Pirellulales bacterium]|nr:hypothetical protein [Pirellulales bacterium]
MSEPLLPASFLFRYSVPCLYLPEGTELRDKTIGEAYRLPNFTPLDGGPDGPEVRVGWNESGLAISLHVIGKRQLPWCRDNRIEDSDGLLVWIDTRDTHNIHRAGRFCHYFVFLPSGGGHRLDEPVAEQLWINRARENARPIRPGMLRARTEKRRDGYILQVHIPTAALTGFDPVEHPRLGFTYCIADREIGLRTFNCGPEFPFRDDPSLWATLELVKPESGGRNAKKGRSTGEKVS